MQAGDDPQVNSSREYAKVTKKQAKIKRRLESDDQNILSKETAKGRLA
jgi:hypothetical protein